ncbi:MAG: polyketide cyclase / dehydrase and lipid transport [Geodermatophilaceae bacterium]
MPTLDLVDETYLRAPAERAAGLFHDQARWAWWWPDLHPVVFMDRGLAGIRWNITGAVVGSMEIWLEPLDPPMGGVLLHYYLRADPTASGSLTVAAPLTGRAATLASIRRARSMKRMLWRVKDELEAPMNYLR